MTGEYDGEIMSQKRPNQRKKNNFAIYNLRQVLKLANIIIMVIFETFM